MVVTLAHAYAPFAILPIYVALETIPKSLLEAAADLGARPFTTFRRVVLPNSMPGVLAAALVVFVPTVGDYVTPALVGGPASTMIGTLIQAQFGKANDWPFGAALSVAVMLVILAWCCVARFADRRFGQPHMSAVSTGEGRRDRWLGAYVFAYLFFLYLPVSLIPLFSFNNSIQAAFPLKGFTPQWYATLFGNRHFRALSVNSLSIGVIAAPPARRSAASPFPTWTSMAARRWPRRSAPSPACRS